MVVSCADCDALQSDLDALAKWEKQWVMVYCVDMILEIISGKDPPVYRYTHTKRYNTEFNIFRLIFRSKH